MLLMTTIILNLSVLSKNQCQCLKLILWHFFAAAFLLSSVRNHELLCQKLRRYSRMMSRLISE